MKTQFGKLTLALTFATLLAACADPTGPTRALLPDAASHAVTFELYSFGPGWPSGMQDGQVRLCKTADAAGIFNFSVTTNGAGNLPSATPSITLLAAGTQCTIVYTSLVANSGVEQVVITETAQQNWGLTGINTRQLLATGIYNAGGYTAPRLSDAENVGSRQATVYINNDMARIVTFTNHFTPPQENTGCTYTKGWYQNKNGSPTVTAVDGRTKLEAQTIFKSTPSPNPAKNLGVTWGTDNLLHNLYQQLLAAILNGGAGGPSAVQQAITDALAGTGGTGLNITTTLTHDQMAALVVTLSNFNEGLFTGWPHCAD